MTTNGQFIIEPKIGCERDHYKLIAPAPTRPLRLRKAASRLARASGGRDNFHAPTASFAYTFASASAEENRPDQAQLGQLFFFTLSRVSGMYRMY
jgi:hypothetical protein